MTRKDIEIALPEGYSINKAEGVWYFVDGDSYMWPDTCTHFCTLDQGTIDQWVDQFNYLRGEYESRKN